MKSPSKQTPAAGAGSAGAEMSQSVPGGRRAAAFRPGSLDFLLDLLYPPICHACGCATRRGRSLCVECHDSLPEIRKPFCATCAGEFEGRIEGIFDCPNCRDQHFAFDFARPAMSRDDRLLEMIHELKYLRRIHLADELGGLAWRAFSADPRLDEALDQSWPLVPVPLHRLRQLWRHFNQAAEIARALSRRSCLPVLHALRRTRATGSQTRLTRRQRLENLNGAFALSRRGRSWLERRAPGAVLVDDVFTTGATSHECARVLRRAGVQKVVVVTVMRG